MYHSCFRSKLPNTMQNAIENIRGGGLYSPKKKTPYFYQMRFETISYL